VICRLTALNWQVLCASAMPERRTTRRAPTAAHSGLRGFRRNSLRASVNSCTPPQDASTARSQQRACRGLVGGRAASSGARGASSCSWKVQLRQTEKTQSWRGHPPTNGALARRNASGQRLATTVPFGDQHAPIPAAVFRPATQISADRMCTVRAAASQRLTRPQRPQTGGTADPRPTAQPSNGNNSQPTETRNAAGPAPRRRFLAHEPRLCNRDHAVDFVCKG